MKFTSPYRRFLTLASAATLFALTVTGLAFGQAQETLRDWQVRCETSGSCVAETTAFGRTDAVTYRFSLKFYRDYGEAPWRVAIVMSGAEPAPTSALILQIDDGANFRFEPDEIVRVGQEFELIGERKIDALMTALRGGDKLWLTFHNPRIRETGLGFSLSGVVASIIWIDEQQSIELVAQPIPDQISQLLALDPFCGMNALPDEFVPENYQLSDDEWLYFVPCMTSAYNQITRVYAVNLRYDEIIPLHFPTYSEDFGWGGTDDLYNHQYDPATRTLTSFTKGRGLGDCGSSARYRWREYNFMLLEFRSWETCDGTRMPADWPVIYPAQK
jgi:uncharacterized protein DUF1176